MGSDWPISVKTSMHADSPWSDAQLELSASSAGAIDHLLSFIRHDEWGNGASESVHWTPLCCKSGIPDSMKWNTISQKCSYITHRQGRPINDVGNNQGSITITDSTSLYLEIVWRSQRQNLLGTTCSTKLFISVQLYLYSTCLFSSYLLVIHLILVFLLHSIKPLFFKLHAFRSVNQHSS